MTEVQQTEKVTPRLKTKYRDEIRGALQEQFQYGNVMQVPGLVTVSYTHLTLPTKRIV